MPRPFAPRWSKSSPASPGRADPHQTVCTTTMACSSGSGASNPWMKRRNMSSSTVKAAFVPRARLRIRNRRCNTWGATCFPERHFLCGSGPWPRPCLPRPWSTFRTCPRPVFSRFPHRPSGRRPMAGRLDVVSVGADDERPVVVGVIDLTDTRNPVVPCSRRQRGSMERIDCRATVRRKADVHRKLRFGTFAKPERRVQRPSGREVRCSAVLCGGSYAATSRLTCSLPRCCSACQSSYSDC